MLVSDFMGDTSSSSASISVPHWVLNEYENHHNDAAKESNLTELIRTHLRGRVKLRLAGDLHHYTRHVSTDEQQKEPQLIVAGGGGAVS